MVRFARAFLLLWLLAAAALRGAGAAPGPAPPARAEPVAVVLRVYVREGCPHCTDAKQALERLLIEWPALRVDYRWVDRDVAARDELVALSKAQGAWPPGVPTFVLRDQVIVGFDPVRTLPAIEQLLATGISAGGPEVEGTPFGPLSASRLGLPLFTLALGLLDGVNPCAMWVLLFLLSMLVRLQDRRRMAIVAGTFVLVGGAVYYAFMAAWLNVFLAVGLTSAVRGALGGAAVLIGIVNVKDGLAWGHGPSLAIPERAKPGLVARMRRAMQAPGLPASLVAVAALAVVVNFVELLCTAGLPAIYTAVLAQHAPGTAAHLAYLGLYIVGYIADDALMVALAVTALGSSKLTERVGRRLKLVSGLVMLGLGAVLLLRPRWLL